MTGLLVALVVLAPALALPALLLLERFERAVLAGPAQPSRGRTAAADRSRGSDALAAPARPQLVARRVARFGLATAAALVVLAAALSKA